MLAMHLRIDRPTPLWLMLTWQQSDPFLQSRMVKGLGMPRLSPHMEFGSGLGKQAILEFLENRQFVVLCYVLILTKESGLWLEMTGGLSKHKAKAHRCLLISY